MEIKYTKGEEHPPMIEDLIQELIKDDFVHFKVLCASEVHHFHKEDESIIQFEDGYMKETRDNGDMLYIDYADIYRAKLYRDAAQYIEDEKKANAFNDNDDWTGNRIQF